MFHPRPVGIALLTLCCAAATCLGAAGEATVTKAQIDEALAKIGLYDRSQSRTPLITVENLIRATSQPDMRSYFAQRLGAVLESDATRDCKLFVCKQLWFLAPTLAAPILEGMLTDEEATDLACYAIARDRSPEADALLRNALKQAQGSALVAVVNLLGDRRDAESVAPIAALASSSDSSIAEAALGALGKIGNAEAAQALRTARTQGTPERRLEASHACLQCAEGLAEAGKHEDAEVMYRELNAPEEPDVIRKAACLGLARLAERAFVPLFDGTTFTGWEGNLDLFRLEDNAIAGGSLERAIPRNEFLCSTTSYRNFELRLKVKLVGKNANAGIQIRSRRIPDHNEVSGYQADMGQVFWGCLYDESRRNRVLARPEAKELTKHLRPGDWNDYVIRCEGNRIQLWLNGYQTVDYTEGDADIPLDGVIGLQIHGGLPSEAWYKEIRIRALP